MLERSVLVGGWILHKSQMGAALLRKAEERTDRMFYWALVNIDQSERMAFHNLHLATVALSSDIDYYGINQVVSGLPGDTSFGSSMTALADGIVLRESTDSPVTFRGWCTCLSADFPAAGLMTGFKKSVSASCFCRECDVDTREDDYTPAPADSWTKILIWSMSTT